MEVLDNHSPALSKKERKAILNLRKLRKSLKFRPKIYKLILQMRQCIKKKNILIKKLKQQGTSRIKTFDKIKNHTTDVQTQTDILLLTENIKKHSETTAEADVSISETKKIIDVSELKSDDTSVKTPGWINENGDKSIAEQVKEAALDAMQESGMVYVESAGMYYDYKTGYYYSPELGLYYHTDTGCYYYYSNETKAFLFHSYPDKSVENTSRVPKQIKKAMKHKKASKPDDVDNLTESLSQDENAKSKRKRRKITKKDEPTTIDIKKSSTEDATVEKEVTLDDIKKEESKEKINDELEDGECSESGSEVFDAETSLSTSTASDDESVAKHHPPCMRIIIRETNLPKLKVGSLYLITKDGGTLGREGEQHALVIRDHNVSRNHLDIRFDMDRHAYFAMDLGSKNGTILNGSRMSESQEISEPMEVVHGSTIQVGETKLLCHVHPGNDTCGHCEPGLIMETQEKEKKVAYTRTCSVQKQHQLELARLKNKYAPEPLAIEEKAYNDRAQARRDHVGSSHHAEKTQSSDIGTFITPENKGFKLLEKMGWSKGEGLGKDNQGDTEPIPLVSNEGKAGLGAAPNPTSAVKKSKTIGPATLRLASKTKMLKPPAKAFQEATEDSE